MKVFGVATDSKPRTRPFPNTFLGMPVGIIVRAMGGDVLEPNNWKLKPGTPEGTETNWFNANPGLVLHFRMPLWASLPLVLLFFYCLGTLVATSPWWLFAFPLYALIPGCYFALRLFSFGMYFGWKIFGVDSNSYKDWVVPREEVFDGSQAMCFTLRFSTKVKTEGT